MVINYDADRAAVDGALHLFVEDTKTNKAGDEEPYRRATYSRVWFQLKGKRAETITAERFQKAM